MSAPDPSQEGSIAPQPLAPLVLRGVLGGALMGLANLVPGISGGTMLLATGIYPRFVAAVAEVSTLRLRPRSLALLAAVASAAALVIVLAAGPVKQLVVEQRWAMYSLFIGLTLGGVPILWRLARPVGPRFLLGAAAGLAAMLALASAPEAATGAGGSATGLLLAGIAGAAAMVLPGVSGGYLLLVLGQYVPILGGIDALKRGLLVPLISGADPDRALVEAGLRVAIPVGIGVVAGIVAVSNAVRWLLDRFPQATLGFLLGLLLGAVVGLWPFQRSVPPHADALLLHEPPVEEWPLERYAPDRLEAAASLGLIVLGFGLTGLIGRIGEERPGR